MTSYNSGNAGVKAEDIWKSAPLVNGNKGGPRTTEPQEAQKQQHQAEGIFGATLASLNVILDTCRRTICSMTGLEYGKPPSTNYILWLFFFIKDALVSPIAGKFYALGQPERIFALGLALVVSWIPALLLFFCIIPSAVIFIVAFYMMMFGLAPLKQHLEEGLNELTGLSTMVLLPPACYTWLSFIGHHLSFRTSRNTLQN